ncbi:hypothetical protein BK127_38740 [Paenibacillus sp. FSL H7-0331]|nr:hypothetical protein BK127_38740 [Paenibacillus sp. FSL H7-0331]
MRHSQKLQRQMSAMMARAVADSRQGTYQRSLEPGPRLAIATAQRRQPRCNAVGAAACRCGRHCAGCENAG